MRARQRLIARVALLSLSWTAWRLARREHWRAELHGRVGSHSRYWQELAERRGDVLYVAIGDSTAQGIGAPDPSGSYVAQLERMLDARLHVINLSISGARLSDIITSLLPRLAALDTADALVTFAAGTNDLATFDPDRFRRELAIIFDALAPHALVAELPSVTVRGLAPTARQANAILHELADERDLAVVPLHAATRRPWPAAIALHHAGDLLHPNARGYRVWARAFLGPAAARLEAIGCSTRPARLETIG